MKRCSKEMRATTRWVTRASITARDSGIDVSYASASKRSSPNHVRNFSKPFAGTERPPDEDVERPSASTEHDEEEPFSPELDDLLHAVHRMAAYTSTTDDPWPDRITVLLHDLGPLAGLEAGVQRLTTSTNSTTAHLTAQTRALQTLAQTLLAPVRFRPGVLDPALIDADEVLSRIAALLDDSPAAGSVWPHPDPRPLRALQHLHRDTVDVAAALAALADTLQLGKQITTAAARHLRNTQTVLVDLRQEHERVDRARAEWVRDDWERRLRARGCARECRDIVAGFEDTCDALRRRLEAGVAAAG